MIFCTYLGFNLWNISNRLNDFENYTIVIIGEYSLSNTTLSLIDSDPIIISSLNDYDITKNDIIIMGSDIDDKYISEKIEMLKHNAIIMHIDKGASNNIVNVIGGQYPDGSIHYIAKQKYYSMIPREGDGLLTEYTFNFFETKASKELHIILDVLNNR